MPTQNSIIGAVLIVAPVLVAVVIVHQTVHTCWCCFRGHGRPCCCGCRSVPDCGCGWVVVVLVVITGVVVSWLHLLFFSKAVGVLRSPGGQNLNFEQRCENIRKSVAVPLTTDFFDFLSLTRPGVAWERLHALPGHAASRLQAKAVLCEQM